MDDVEPVKCIHKNKLTTYNQQLTTKKMYQLKTEQFSGPIETLLDLIEKKDLEITEFNLAAVTADFLEYLQKQTNIESPRLLADFVAVASRLLLIKSRALLPDLKLTEEEEKGIEDLEVQLKFYQNFKPAVSLLKELWESENFSISRPFMAGRPAIFYPSENITKENLFRAANSLLAALNQLAIETKTIKSPLISLEDKIKEIAGLLENKMSALKFKDLNERKSRSEAIVMFLALLHLIHSQLVKAEQEGRFSDIMIKKI